MRVLMLASNTTILGATNRPNPRISETKLLVGSNSKNGSGPVDRNRAMPHFKKLQSNSADGVLFDENKIDQSCYGGTCSAIALKFADLLTQSKTNNFQDRVFEAAQQCQESSVDLRTQQAALNSISIDSNRPPKDPSFAKVKSIVALRGFTIDHFTQSMGQTIHGATSFSDFKKTVSGLPHGVYFIRLLNKADNYKLENFGHSVIFLNYEGAHYFWGYGDGLIQLGDNTYIQDLYDKLFDISFYWCLQDPRFYRIKKQTLLDKLEQKISNLAMGKLL